jgi:hypothetical protein
VSPPTTSPRLITPGVIASELRVPLHRVLHVLATRPHILPRARARSACTTASPLRWSGTS